MKKEFSPLFHGPRILTTVFMVKGVESLIHMYME